ncbi:DUF4374 domain-containing protein [Dyadobacter sp. CY261]|uniref:DUF4374 domain-containing protein n=1 Tax=Dyadobacter sp. CY261 TaxID=2907203 RepID=UPI001F2A50A7|nr:DUF4374 domain-containing protein [Dyadobacter sp. CY261]MCF0071218.1 DUF4374 domain-containing protein [Dyadobacter sp. CY261]
MAQRYRSVCHFALLLLFVSVWMNGCQPQNHEDKGGSKKKYSIYVMMQNGKEYVLQTDSLASGELSPEKTGARVVPAPLYYDLIIRDGQYYSIDRRRKSFVRYKIANGEFVADTAIAVTGFPSVENYNWISRDSLMILGYDDEARKVRYVKIQVSNMTISQGTVPIPAPFGGYNWLSIGFSQFLDNKLYIGYCYHAYNLNNYTTGDTIYTAVLDYSRLTPLNTLKDTRSVYPGGENTRQSHSFVTEKGDFYFIACPGIAAGNYPNKATGIFRIKQSQEEIDPDYFFNISTSPIKNHGYGFWYVGNGKAIVRTERKGIYTGMKDHYKVPHFDFYLLDLEKQTTSRLDLPLDKGTARQCVLVEDGTVYITVSSGNEGRYVWLFNPETGSLKKGLKFSDDTEYILRLERLN